MHASSQILFDLLQVVKELFLAGFHLLLMKVLYAQRIVERNKNDLYVNKNQKEKAHS